MINALNWQSIIQLPNGTSSALNPENHHHGAGMLANRLRKNLKHLSRWRKREQIYCYRLYDADIPEYALAIDIYESADNEELRWVHVQEYEAPRKIDESKTKKRLQAALSVIREVLEIPEEQLFLKVRRQQKGHAQYEKLANSRGFHQVMEGGNRFLVNFRNYLDTGLFLDHRITRSLLRELALEKSFLNLFAYTGSASVYAARGGATSTLTVDMSHTYLDWARRNMALNGFKGQAHAYIQADCIEWLDRAAKKYRFDLIFLDPPSFSSSKRMRSTFDVQRDHVMLLEKTSRLLTTNGILIFSNNRRQFKMDHAALSELKIENISRTTLPKDFERNPKIHNCWKIQRQNSLLEK